MQSSSEQPLVGEERYVTTRITAAKETMRPGARFSKVPKTIWARKAIPKTAARLFCKAGLFI